VPPNIGKGLLWSAIAGWVVACVAIIAFTYVIITRPGGAEVTVKGKDGEEISVKFDKSTIDPKTYIDKLMTNAFVRPSVVDYMKEHSLYDISDTSIVKAIKKLEYASDVATMLREISRKREGPFKTEDVDVFVGVYKGNTKGNAAVCDGSDFVRADIQLFDPQNGRAIIVAAGNRAVCPGGKVNHELGVHKDNFIQIGLSDKRCLFGDAGIGEYIMVKAIQMPFGYKPKIPPGGKEDPCLKS